MKSFLVVVATALVGWTAAAGAAPLDLNHVSADARFVAHWDFDAARASPVVQGFFQECTKDMEWARDGLTKICQKMGLDQCKDLHGVTLYSAVLQPHHGVLMARADWNAKTLEENVQKAPDHKTTEHGKHKIHTFTAHRGTKHAHPAAATLYQPDLLVLASSTELLHSALDVLDGQAANLAGKDSPLAAPVPPGAIVVARAVDLKDSKAAEMHPGLKLIRSFDYAKGQHEGKWFGRIAVTAESEDVARKLGKVAEGYGAWLSLHAHDTPWFLDLLSKAMLTVEGNVVKVSFETPVDTLTSRMPEICTSVRDHLKLHMAKMKMHCKMMMKMHKRSSDHHKRCGPKKHEKKG